MDRPANRRRQRHVTPERAALVRQDRGHALVAGRPGVGIDGFADFWLLGVLEPPALGDREIVGARLGEARAEPDRVLEIAAAGHDLVAQVSDTDDVIVTDPGADSREHLER